MMFNRPEGVKSEEHLQPLVLAIVLSLFLAFVTATLIYYNFIIWRDYIEIVAWAFLLSQALYGPQKAVVAKLKQLRDLEGLEKPKPECADGSPQLRVRRSSLPRDSNYGDTEMGLLEHLEHEFWAWLNPKSSGEIISGLYSTLINNAFWSFTLFLFLSLLQRMFTWAWIIGGFCMAAATILLLLYVLDWNMLWFWTPVISDETLVSLVLAAGALGSVFTVFVFLGIQSTIEGYEAVAWFVNWMHDHVLEKERLTPVWEWTLQMGQVRFWVWEWV